MPPVEHSRTSADSTSMTITDGTSSSFIEGMPVEVMEMIFGKINFIDLQKVLLVSKTVMFAFQASRYYRQLGLVAKHERRACKLMCKGMALNSLITWPLHDVLKVFLHPFCEGCGQYGSQILWIATPPKKLCPTCRCDNPEYQLIKLNNMKKKYGLTKDALARIPTWSAISLFSDDARSASTIYALRCDIQAITTLKELNFAAQSFVIDKELGTIPVKYIDHSTGQSWKFSKCYWCHPKPPTSECCNDDTCGYNSTIIPHCYGALKEHIALNHPEIIEPFELGWEKLWPSLRARWLRHREGPGLDPINKTCFVNWAQVAMEELSNFEEVEYSNHAAMSPLQSATELRSTLYNAKIDVGQLFGIPKTPFEDERHRETLVSNAVMRIIQMDFVGRFSRVLIKQMETEGVDAVRQYLDSVLKV